MRGAPHAAASVPVGKKAAVAAKSSVKLQKETLRVRMLVTHSAEAAAIHTIRLQ